MAFKETVSEIATSSKPDKLDFNADKLIGSETKESKSETKQPDNKPVDADKLIEPNKIESRGTEVEQPEVKGGSYRDVKKGSNGETHQVHHMPAKEVNGLPPNDGPAIKMEKLDHKKTASWGASPDARKYRKEQEKYISEGNFKEAMQMDINDIHDKFGDKYDDAISQMISYAEEKGLI